MFGLSIWQLLFLIFSSCLIAAISYSPKGLLFRIVLIGILVVAMRNFVLN